jgi:hypothetical protein
MKLCGPSFGIPGGYLDSILSLVFLKIQTTLLFGFFPVD